MAKLILRSKSSMASVDQIFLSLLSLDSIDSDSKQILLRNKSSFTNQMSDQMFIESYFKKNFNNNYYKKILKQIFYKFKIWAQNILAIAGKSNFGFKQDSAERDIFGQEFSELDGEEFDLDNVLL